MAKQDKKNLIRYLVLANKVDFYSTSLCTSVCVCACAQVLLAIGKEAATHCMGLEGVGVQCGQEWALLHPFNCGFDSVGFWWTAVSFALFSCCCCCCCCCCSGRILVNKSDQTSVDHIYAVGSVQHGRPSSSGLSVHAGTLLARRLYRGENIQVLWNTFVIFVTASCNPEPHKLKHSW